MMRAAAGKSSTLGSTAEKLLQVARVKSDDLRSELASIHVARNSCQTALAQLDHSLLTEQHRVEAKGDALSQEMLAQFSDRIRIKRTNMLATLSQYDAREEHLNIELTELYREIKKFEHLIDIAQTREKKRRAQIRERKANEIVGMRYGR